MSTFTTLADLKEQLDYHNGLFWGENKSVISDSEYDLLKNRFDTLAAEHPNWEYNLDQKATVVFSTKTELKRVPHFRPFPSLNRTYDFGAYEELKASFDNDVYIETKLDGMALELQYEYGKLKHLVTKGTLIEGENITHQLSYFKHIPPFIEQLKDVDKFDIRAEAHLTYLDIEDLKESTNTPDFKQRNQISGWLRSSLNNRFSVKGKITCSVYAIDPKVLPLLKIESGLQLRSWFTDQGFDIPRLVTEKELLTQASNTVEPFDGYVMKANKLSTRQRLGDEMKWSIAFKYNTLFGVTRFKDVEWSVTRCRITPTLIYEPVMIAGSKCQRANGFNAGKLLGLQIGAGDRIRIVMSGDSVPHLDEVIDRTDTPRMRLPETCPCCGGPVSLIGPTLTCNNTADCADQFINDIVRATGKEGLDIKDVGRETITEWAGRGFIKTVLDIYSLELEQVGARFYEIIRQNRKKTLSQFIYALNIEEVGKSTADEISHLCVNIEKFLEFIKDHELIKKTFTPAKTMYLLKAFTDKKRVRYIERFAAALTIRPDTFIRGYKKVVLTGRFEAPRNFIAEQLLKSDIEVLPRVVKGVECVIVGFSDTETASTTQALKLNIPVYYVNNEISINDIVRKING